MVLDSAYSAQFTETIIGGLKDNLVFIGTN